MRGLLLVLFLFSLSLYVLGIASLVASSRIGVAPTDTPLVSLVRQTVLIIATEAAAAETPLPTSAAATLVPALVIRATPTASGSITATPTLEPTPTQLRNVPRILVPPEPSVAPILTSVLISPVVTPGNLTPTTPRALLSTTPTARTPSPPGLRPLTTASVSSTPRVLLAPGEGDEPASATPTVRLGGPITVGTPAPGTSGVQASPTPAPPLPIGPPSKPAAPTASPTVRR